RAERENHTTRRTGVKSPGWPDACTAWRDRSRESEHRSNPDLPASLPSGHGNLRPSQKQEIRMMSGSSRRAALLTGLSGALFLASTLLYGPALENGFVNFDDDWYVTNNPQVLGGLEPRGMLWALTSTHAANWHPLTWWSLQFDAALFGPG